jgi:hypothetical protein
MHRIFFASAAIMLIGLAPQPGSAASFAQRPVTAANPSITLVDGWWEQEHHEQDAPDHYWRLQQQQRERYDRLQSEQYRREQQRRRFNEDDRRALQEQHRLLGFQIIIH